MWLAAILNIAAKTIPEVLVRLDDQQELGNEIVAEDHVLLGLLSSCFSSGDDKLWSDNFCVLLWLWLRFSPAASLIAMEQYLQ